MYTLLLLIGAAVSSNAFLDSLLPQVLNFTCNSNEFACQTGKCIPMSKRCDSSNDCLDFSDEENCDVYLCKEPRYFKCANGRCISKSFVCDEENDCEDFSDEKNCDNFKLTYQANQTCSQGEWQCQDKLCIMSDWVCNGEEDCLDGSDETIGCSAKIECDGFKCNNGHCIPNEWVCDGNDDCIDNSDEQDCINHIDPKSCTLDNNKFLCSNNKTCLEMHLVCDGIPQCPDKSDESSLCHQPEKLCASHACSHTCLQLPTGPKCVCPKGYHTIDEKHCEDINECEIFGICDQKCRNTHGSYECYCENRYSLQSDKKSCQAIGGEAMMVFSSKTEIRAITLKSEIYFPVAKHLKQVVGVKYDGHHVYWTDIFAEHESIVRSVEDGSQRELLVSAGLGLPEDLAIDWMTGNIYFTDAEKLHIGVCSNDGAHCTVLINQDIRKPRAICLNIDNGEMFWTDWGKPAEIAISYMDGTNDRPFVHEDIHWPNGLALDNPNERLYWTDARKMTLESIKLDGTDRRIVLQSVIKHPYAIAVFEDRLFWSDWATHSIQYCNKFTGKNHTTLVKENREYIYGIDIFHSALRTRIDNPCAMSFCSDLCLLSGSSYTCACSQSREMNSDRHSCKDIEKKKMLILGGTNTLVSIEHKKLGKHDITALPTSVKNVGALAYNSINDTLYVSDLTIKKIISINLKTGTSTPLDIDNLGKITCMDYDHFGNNLYICDEQKAAIEIINLNTMATTVILHDLHGEIPESIALIPEEGVMFIALKKHGSRESHIDRMYMDGTGRTQSITSGLFGPISLTFDYDLYRVFWSDAGTGNIDSTSIDGDDKHNFRSLSSSPIGITILDNDVFWVNQFSRRVYWAEKNATTTANKKVTLDIPDDMEKLHIISVMPKRITHNPCQVNNGNCSHICLVSHKSTTCACPVGMTLNDDHSTCSKRISCAYNEFFCKKSNTCILSSYMCNGHNDCPNGEDEIDCKKPNHCPLGHFQCSDGECIKEIQMCDHHYDCKDKSDEHNCEHITLSTCLPDHFMCSNKQCIHEKYICDGSNDCLDGSDEKNCASNTCEVNEFRCNSGQCIPKTWECDHEYDCLDMSDEHTQCEGITCSPEMFRCSNGKCIDMNLICDNSDDCGDNSDEFACKLKMTGHCGVGEFPCASNTSICVLESAKCNGTSECPHHEDEKDCSDCNVDEFSCNNKKCIPTQWLCDKVDDCGDGSDEKEDFCQHKPGDHVSPLYVACTDGFRCKTGACIDKKLLCNGKHDCYDGSDEDGLCSTACVGAKNPCSQECIKTPIGPLCACKEGYRLTGDGYSCADINECEQDPPICSQLCINRDGGYACDCYDGFLLRSDKKSCKASGERMYMVYTSDNQVRELRQQTNSLNVIYADDTPKITGIDVSVDQDYVYFSIENSGTIHRINTLTKKREYMEHVGQPQKIAVDWSTNNVYYVNSDPTSKSISVCNFDEKVCTRLINIDIHRQVSAIAVDSVNKVLFYSLTSWFVFNSPNYVIYKCNLDGTGAHELVESSTGYVTGITYDLNAKVVFFIDQHNSKINSVSYHGRKNTVLFANITRPISVKFYENHLYYSGVGGFMTKCKLFDNRVCDSFKLHSYSSELFAFNQRSIQPHVTNQCLNNTCSDLCVPSDSTYKCVCEDGSLISSSERCSAKERSSDDDDGSNHHVHTVEMREDGKTKSGTGTVITAILIPLSLAVFGAFIFLMVKRRNSGNFNVSMRFYNPTYGRQTDVTDNKPILQPGQHEYTNPNYEENGTA